MERVPVPLHLKARARALRERQTSPEAFLWQLLRGRRLAGAKFRRQHPLPPYTLDFYCAEQRLAIELDGGGHAERSEEDAARDRFLDRAGIRLLRFWNRQLYDDLETVLEVIWDQVATR